MSTERFQVYRGNQPQPSQETESYKRRLAAIFSADVKGYSKMMGANEEKTVQTITEYREVMSRLVQSHSGRVIDSVGDNMLAEFGSVIDAIEAAVEIQMTISKKNETLPKNNRMKFRIGINIGGVITERERIYGDGVNIAARLEGLASAGGICISGAAHEQVKGKLPYKYNYLGKQSVKNISTLVKAYQVELDPNKKINKSKFSFIHYIIGCFVGITILYETLLKYFFADINVASYQFLNPTNEFKYIVFGAVLLTLIIYLFVDKTISRKISLLFKGVYIFLASVICIGIFSNFISIDYLNSNMLYSPKHNFVTIVEDSTKIYSKNDRRSEVIMEAGVGDIFMLEKIGVLELQIWNKVIIPNNNIGSVRIKKNEKSENAISQKFVSIRYFHVLALLLGFFIVFILKKIKLI